MKRLLIGISVVILAFAFTVSPACFDKKQPEDTPIEPIKPKPPIHKPREVAETISLQDATVCILDPDVPIKPRQEPGRSRDGSGTIIRDAAGVLISLQDDTVCGLVPGVPGTVIIADPTAFYRL